MVFLKIPACLRLKESLKRFNGAALLKVKARRLSSGLLNALTFKDAVMLSNRQKTFDRLEPRPKTFRSSNCTALGFTIFESILTSVLLYVLELHT